MEQFTLWGVCGLLIMPIPFFARESSVGILNIFYALTRRMPLLKITSVCGTKRYSIVAESMCDLKMKGTSKYLISKVGIFDLI